MEELINMKRSIIMSILLVFLSLVILTGCDNNIALLYSGSNIGNKINGSYKLFTGTRSKTINIEKGKTILIDYSSEVNKGELTMKIFDSDEKVALELDTNTSGSKELKSKNGGKYELIITGSKSDGNFSIKWDEK